ncbi:hypothetical protein NEOKW01_0871 [Nematocida sp. AWRm80]|nr:hypothetical protein NEOKW01_0871 [Nematocida sp. AWRm80]
MDALNRFLRVKRKSEYISDRGKIKLTKEDKKKINKYKKNRPIKPFVIEREINSAYVCDTLAEPVREAPTQKKKEETGNFLQKFRKIQKRLEDREKLEEIEDLWEGREGASENTNRKLSRKTKRPKSIDAYTKDSSLFTTRESIWKSIHFYRDSIRRPRMYTSDLEKIHTKLSSVKIKVPEDLEIPEIEYTYIKYNENIRDTIPMYQGVYDIIVHSSSITIRDRQGYLPSRTVRLYKEKEEVLIRTAQISPDESKLALITINSGIIILKTDYLVNQRILESNLDISQEKEEYQRLFPEKTFRKGTWHPKGIYFAAIFHGQVAIVNTKKNRGMVFYKGAQKIQHIEFHPTKSIIILVGPSNIFFHSLRSQKRETKLTINHLSSANTLALSFDLGIMYVGSGLSQVHILTIDKKCVSKFIRAVHTTDTPRKISIHKKYGYASVFDKTPTYLVYLNRLAPTEIPAEKSGVIHRYNTIYRTGSFPSTRPIATYAHTNTLSVLYPQVQPLKMLSLNSNQ